MHYKNKLKILFFTHSPPSVRLGVHQPAAALPLRCFTQHKPTEQGHRNGITQQLFLQEIGQLSTTRQQRCTTSRTFRSPNATASLSATSPSGTSITSKRGWQSKAIWTWRRNAPTATVPLFHPESLDTGRRALWCAYLLDISPFSRRSH